DQFIDKQNFRHEPAARERTITIDRLNVMLGEMEVRQYLSTRPDDPVIVPVSVGLDRSFSGVTDLEPVVEDLAKELILRSSLGIFSNIDTVLDAVTDEKGNLDPRLRDHYKEQFKDLKKLFMP
ncbi:MAG: hypothetical protein ACO398_10465, partial [Kiritimatiellia bacterium]